MVADSFVLVPLQSYIELIELYIWLYVEMH